MTEVLAFAFGFLAGALFLGLTVVALKRRRWHRRYRPHRYLEIL